MPENLENSAEPRGWEKVSFHSNPRERAMPKNVQTAAQLFHMLRILQVRLQQYMKRELPDVQAGFTKSRGTKGQIANICWIIEKAGEF